MKVFKLIIIVIVVILSACKDANVTQQPSLVTTVQTQLTKRADVTRLHEIPAVFLAENRANLSFQLSGTINQSLVKIGEHVQQNQILMSLYNPNISPALNTNMARLESIQAQIAQAQRDVARLAELRKNNSASKTAFELKETSLKDLIAQKKAVKAQISLALANQSEATIKAPFAGTIVTIDAQVGEFVRSGQVVMAIYQQDMLEVEVNLTLQLWDNISLDDNIAGIYNGEIIEFRVVELAQVADAKSHLMKVIFKLTSSIDNAVGQQVTLQFPQMYQAVYQLPLEVIVDDGINKPYIFTVVNNIAVKHYIEPLFIDNGYIVFGSDADIQNPVVIKGQSRISAGTKLQVAQ
ncbi:hypothetical protein MNBD_GAMMA01-765 [hydrothermal vent metagenome]|uniref:Uncharacterized protein n=1 Tax=hydrothermal vent metagenome TaxID=652676 RepID=A0A3B0V4Z6_9ZZZZ